MRRECGVHTTVVALRSRTYGRVAPSCAHPSVKFGRRGHRICERTVGRAPRWPVAVSKLGSPSRPEQVPSWGGLEALKLVCSHSTRRLVSETLDEHEERLGMECGRGQQASFDRFHQRQGKSAGSRRHCRAVLGTGVRAHRLGASGAVAGGLCGAATSAECVPQRCGRCTGARAGVVGEVGQTRAPRRAQTR